MCQRQLELSVILILLQSARILIRLQSARKIGVVRLPLEVTLEHFAREPGVGLHLPDSLGLHLLHSRLLRVREWVWYRGVCNAAPARLATLAIASFALALFARARFAFPSQFIEHAVLVVCGLPCSGKPLGAHVRLDFTPSGRRSRSAASRSWSLCA